MFLYAVHMREEGMLQTNIEADYISGHASFLKNRLLYQESKVLVCCLLGPFGTNV